MQSTLLQINVSSNFGSTGKIVEQVGHLAMNQGWHSYVAYGRENNPSKLKTIQIGTMRDVYVHFAKSRIFDKEGLASVASTKKFIKRIDEIQPDVIQLHNIHDHYLNYRLLFDYIKNKDIPVVWTMHDCWAFTGHCFHFEAIGCDKWKTGCFSCPLKSVYPKALIDRSKKNFLLKKEVFTSVKNMTIITVSHWLEEVVKESFFGRYPVKVINNGIDLGNFHRMRDFTNSVNKFHILGVSSIWDASKGLNDFYKMREKLSEKRFEITLVGLTEKQVSELPKGIKGIIRTENVQELNKLYSESDVFVNPTYNDSFPTVNMEAIACGTPVITYRTGGSPEIIDKQTGYVVEQGDLEGMVTAIENFANKPTEEKVYIRKLCRDRAERLYNKDARFQDYILIYQSLL